MTLECASSGSVSIYLSRDCCRINSVHVSLCQHLDFKLVIFKVPDKVIILGICVYFILKLMLWSLI